MLINFLHVVYKPHSTTILTSVEDAGFNSSEISSGLYTGSYNSILIDLCEINAPACWTREHL